MYKKIVFIASICLSITIGAMEEKEEMAEAEISAQDEEEQESLNEKLSAKFSKLFGDNAKLVEEATRLGLLQCLNNKEFDILSTPRSERSKKLEKLKESVLAQMVIKMKRDAERDDIRLQREAEDEKWSHGIQICNLITTAVVGFIGAGIATTTVILQIISLDQDSNC